MLRMVRLELRLVDSGASLNLVNMTIYYSCTQMHRSVL